LASVAERIGFNYQRLASASSRGAMLDTLFAHRKLLATDLRLCPALLALLLAWRFSPEMDWLGGARST